MYIAIDIETNNKKIKFFLNKFQILLQEKSISSTGSTIRYYIYQKQGVQ